MLSADLTITSNASGLTLPGSAAATVFAQISGNATNNEITRRVAATATITPQTVRIGHTESGSGFKKRIRTLVRYDYVANNTDISDTGGVTPSFSAYLVLDRPTQSGGAITDTLIKNGIGSILHVILASGQLDKLLNLES